MQLGSKGYGDPVVFDNTYFVTLLDKPWERVSKEMGDHIGALRLLFWRSKTTSTPLGAGLGRAGLARRKGRRLRQGAQACVARKQQAAHYP